MKKKRLKFTAKVEDLAGLKTAFPSNEAKIKKRVEKAIERLEGGNPPFNCKRCGNLYKPDSEMFIFHELCDNCFVLFDAQKMAGRRGSGNLEYFEDAVLWIKNNPIKHTTKS